MSCRSSAFFLTSWSALGSSMSRAALYRLRIWVRLLHTAAQLRRNRDGDVAIAVTVTRHQKASSSFSCVVAAHTSRYVGVHTQFSANPGAFGVAPRGSAPSCRCTAACEPSDDRLIMHWHAAAVLQLRWRLSLAWAQSTRCTEQHHSLKRQGHPPRPN